MFSLADEKTNADRKRLQKIVEECIDCNWRKITFRAVVGVKIELTTLSHLIGNNVQL